jgi:hypothetical protein
MSPKKVNISFSKEFFQKYIADFAEIEEADTVDNYFSDDDSENVINKIFEKCKIKKVERQLLLIIFYSIIRINEKESVYYRCATRPCPVSATILQGLVRMNHNENCHDCLSNGDIKLMRAKLN